MAEPVSIISGGGTFIATAAGLISGRGNIGRAEQIFQQNREAARAGLAERGVTPREVAPSLIIAGRTLGTGLRDRPQPIIPGIPPPVTPVPTTPIPTTPPPPGAPLPPTGDFGPLLPERGPPVFAGVGQFGRIFEGFPSMQDEPLSAADLCETDPTFRRAFPSLCAALLGEPEPFPAPGSLEMPRGRRRQPPRFEGLFESRRGVGDVQRPQDLILLRAPLPRGPIVRPGEQLRQILRGITRLGRIIFPGQVAPLEPIPELFPVRLPERQPLPQPRRVAEPSPAIAPGEAIPETVTVPQTAPPASPAFPRARAPVLGRISLAAGAALASAVGINLLQRQTTRLGARIGEPFAPTAPPPIAPPAPPLVPPPTLLSPVGQQAQLRTRQRECQEVKRRRRRKGKCREGFFEELPGRTRFTTWREVDCTTRRNVRTNPLRGI